MLDKHFIEKNLNKYTIQVIIFVQNNQNFNCLKKNIL
jgi:hypothetical protein